ncbi:MAG TPA: sigma-70 family RNA polymerase sigma factor [Pseudonocardiaceae bacterium]
MGPAHGDTDEQLLRRLHDDHAGVLYAFVSRYTDDRQLVEDVVQETLLRAWQRLEHLDTDDPRSYLFTVARNVLTDGWRARQRRPVEVDAEHTPPVPVPDQTDRTLDSMLVAEALHRLSAEHRSVVELLYFHGRSVADSAQVLGIAEGTVKSRAYYAVRALRSIFEELGVSR